MSIQPPKRRPALPAINEALPVAPMCVRDDPDEDHVKALLDCLARAGAWWYDQSEEDQILPQEPETFECVLCHAFCHYTGLECEVERMYDPRWYPHCEGCAAPMLPAAKKKRIVTVMCVPDEPDEDSVKALLMRLRRHGTVLWGLHLDDESRDRLHQEFLDLETMLSQCAHEEWLRSDQIVATFECPRCGHFKDREYFDYECPCLPPNCFRCRCRMVERK